MSWHTHVRANLSHDFNDSIDPMHRLNERIANIHAKYADTNCHHVACKQQQYLTKHLTHHEYVNSIICKYIFCVIRTAVD